MKGEDRFSLIDNRHAELVSCSALCFETDLGGERFEVVVDRYPGLGESVTAVYCPSKDPSRFSVVEASCSPALDAADIAALARAVADREGYGGEPVASRIERNKVELKQNVVETLAKGSLIVSEELLELSKVDCFVLCADLRSFSDWMLRAGDGARMDFFKGFADIMSYITQNCRCDFYKLLGDGVLIIWHSATLDSPARVADAAFDLISYFGSIIESIGDGLKNFGAAITRGEITHFILPSSQSCICMQDYIGLAINYAARFQTLAGSGEVVLDSGVREAFAGLPVEVEARRVQSAFKGVEERELELYWARRKE